MFSHTLTQLPYAYNALEPWIDAQTMELHHSRHHQTYINNYLKLLEGTWLTEKYSPLELLQHIDEVPAEKKQGVINNLGGHINHSLFWSILWPVGGAPTGELLEKITATFGSFDTFKEQFSAKAMGVFGSGWAWLSKDSGGNLVLSNTSNQNSPLSEWMIPLLTIDVWEHAYYLKYQNKRADYVTAFWNVMNWDEVAKFFANGL